MNYEQILYDVSDRIATITLNRPERLNAWTLRMEAEVRKFRDILTANQPLPDETFQQLQTRIKTADAQYPEVAASLGDMLIAPVRPKLGSKRLLIVADGALHYVPFQALTVPTGNRAARTDERIPLLVDHEIVYEPSASALALVLNDRRDHPTPNSVAVFANATLPTSDDVIVNELAPSGMS